MEKSTENNNKQRFLKEGLRGDISKHHKKYLGTELPKGYFAKSKLSILERIQDEAKIAPIEKPKKHLVFWTQPQFKYRAVASLVFMLSLTVWLQNSNKEDAISAPSFELLAFSDDVLVNSLLIEDSEVDAFTEAILFKEVLVKAELSEQKLDNLILNSLILEDSLLGSYMDDKFIESIIL
ncbi:MULTISPECIES: hypothetical protein [unclassified Polaribacter]|uniref:hypothetical protein n=1 Tax=unclassified Polaribacter TaxID=196858 RepID=UPI0011BDA59E|nr:MULTISPECIES: hypothetical protein [unclassified Polaribacter]TXD54395.1 hypothetical protein ES043_00670 [Polaribacter sp. IC063]TXD62774.1 hypothetical protein ES044_00090 [Polaribacter sp. IC066]